MKTSWQLHARDLLGRAAPAEDRSNGRVEPPTRGTRRPPTVDGTQTELNANSRNACHVRRTRVYVRGPADRVIRRGVLVHDRPSPSNAKWFGSDLTRGGH